MAMKIKSQPDPRKADKLPATAPMVAKNSIIRALPSASDPVKGETDDDDDDEEERKRRRRNPARVAIAVAIKAVNANPPL